MAKAKVKTIHLTKIRYNYGVVAVCDNYLSVQPIEATIKDRCRISNPVRGTFDPTKVTCKRCLKHPLYKEAMDKINYPLLFWRENTV